MNDHSAVRNHTSQLWASTVLLRYAFQKSIVRVEPGNGARKIYHIHAI